MSKPIKILLCALNSKYIHSCLALYYLKAYCRPEYQDVKVREFTINDNIDYIIGEIYDEKPDLAGFSCYIWNMKKTLLIADTIKKILPHCKIVLGGPEVSFDGVDLMKDNPAVDFIITGEGEVTFKELIDAVVEGESFDNIKGIIYRENGGIIKTSSRPLIQNLDNIPFPYYDGFDALKNRIIYYESSRGCPFNCRYCLSSTIAGVRYFSLRRVEEDIKFFVNAGIPLVKFVDRTFNCNPERAKQLFRMIIEMGGKTSFHFEIVGSLIDDEMLDILKAAPPGLFRFEIGVQSTHPATLEAVGRKMDFEALKRSVSKIRKSRNIYLHLDLIAGLPGESYDRFKYSFNDVYVLKPDKIQLGFLKLLKGTDLRRNAQQYGYKFTDYPPYEVLENNDITFEELLKLKRIEDLVEKYYNSRRFDNSLNYLIGVWGNNPFEFFEDFMQYWQENGFHRVRHNLLRLYEILLTFGIVSKKINVELFKDLLRFDFVLQEKPKRYPEGLQKEISGRKKVVYDFFKDDENVKRYIPYLSQYTAKQIARMVHIEIFSFDIIEGIETGKYPERDTAVLFDYNVTDKNFRHCRFCKIRL